MTLRVGRYRWLPTALALIAFIIPSSEASALENEVVRCWYERAGGFGRTSQLICRIVGSEATVAYEGIQPPPQLHPAVGDDGNGACWYNRTVFTSWRIVATRGDGSAYMWYAPDTRWIDVGWIRRCSAEPTDITTPVELVWEVVAAFDFEVPDAELQPQTGVTGLETFAIVNPPESVVERLTSPGTGAQVEVEFAVATVTVDWDDGQPEIVPPQIYELFGPYPDGGITHMYETKGDYDVSIAYDWRVRWRVDAGPWQPINDIDPTVWATPYQVDEIVTRVTG